MKTKTRANRSGFIPLTAGFTLIEILTVIAIIAVLASILVPVAGKAKKTAMKRRAMAEMNSIKVATMQFHDDHRYMPWPDEDKVGDDMWATSEATQAPVMELLTGENPMHKLYLQIPDKSKGQGGLLTFVDPWGVPYTIGMDRDMDGAVVVANTDPDWNGETVMERVLVYSPGPPDDDEPMKTFDISL